MPLPCDWCDECPCQCDDRRARLVVRVDDLPAAVMPILMREIEEHLSAC